MKIAPGSTVIGVVLLGALAAGAGGCVVTHGDYGISLNTANQPQVVAPPPLVVSAREAATYATSYLGLVEVTFENRTDVWKEVDHVAIDFGSKAKNESITIPSGDDIATWERAIRLRRFAEGQAQGSTAIEWLGLGYSFNTLGGWAIQQPGPAAAEGPTAAPGRVSATPPSYPDQHLLSTPFRVPPGLFTKRWILLSTPNNPPGGCINTMILSYETSDHQTGRVLLPIRATASDWQQQTCYPSLTGGRPAGQP